ncbi:zinc ribbon domain-containing protein [Rhodococcus sp. HNM0563]|uniref:FmdB family zinc ribbon protein n=1 Tax=unclassified Rhodococcus (in: high G+C Gram-positive bacteria) TaxID=192944 RepID=UPI00146CD1E8|nr:zinc ribbon domain-containing protein [Rhodococcus sp. HNM0563]MCK0089786.1 zinc ribbon domain-containing protein [Rhodococcus sp. F64268]NLU62265.1 zinc ribbon domain-containing protein [Rhodococcus sp. HNM0563]
MPLYDFRCAECGPFDASIPMNDVGPSTACPSCGQHAPRAITAPRLGRGSSTAMRLHDATARTASEPGVVSGELPGGPRRAPRPVSTDPRHRLLPRP